MGRRDEPELTPSNADLAEAEAATRELLARFGEPASAQQPPGLVSRILASLPTNTLPGRNRLPWWSFQRPMMAWGLTVIAALLIALGGLSALAGAAAAAGVAIGPIGVLAALNSRPLGNLLPVSAPAVILIGLGLAIAAVAWYGLRRRG